MNCGPILALITTVLGIYLGILMQRPVSSLSDSDKCPLCYGIDLCDEINTNRVVLVYENVRDFFYNLFSVKNVYFGRYDGERIVLKKLGHNSELDHVTRNGSVDEDAVLAFMDRENRSVGSFKSCTKETSVGFLKKVLPYNSLEEIWTILQVNVEPLLLRLFPSDKFAVPELQGSCGFLIIEKDCGLPLNHFQDFPWRTRAFLALQLLEAALDFTHKHPDFRLYLTDVSPDNVAVDDDLNVRFVDLENVIIQKKTQDQTIHSSEHYSDEDFLYDEEEVCRSSISDHNVYAVCRLILSRKAPWPMMAEGLLHPPEDTNNELLFDLVEKCVENGSDRFAIARELMRMLKDF